MGIELVGRRGDVVREVMERVRVGLGESDGCVKEVGWGVLKVDFGVACGRCRGLGYTPTVRAGACMLFVDGWQL